MESVGFVGCDPAVHELDEPDSGLVVCEETCGGEVLLVFEVVVGFPETQGEVSKCGTDLS